MKLKIILILVTVLAVLFAIWAIFFYREKSALLKIQTFEECLINGYPVQESYPRQCLTPDGRAFVEIIENEPVTEAVDKSDLIVLEAPLANAVMTSPLLVTGRARGYWFFEASFPIELYDANGESLAIGIAQAQSDWMTEEFVDFVATLEFENDVEQPGKLILRKDNPSDLPEHDDELEVQVVIGF